MKWNNSRVRFLDPKQYGGTFEEPYAYVEPAKHRGWMSLAEIFVPGFDGCNPSNSNFLQLKDISVPKSFFN